jgi:catechol 2,3-dioxygenase-like lactoylglutathione lyase family enzyme
MATTPKLGHHIEICFSVEDLDKSVNFYQKMGFKIYTGGPNKGWCTVTDGIIYLALFPDKFIEKEFGIPVLFNYRGGNIGKIVKFLREKGMKFTKENVKENGIGDAIMKDINGRIFYFDTSPEEERIGIEEVD